MRYLIDTHTFLWFVDGSAKLPAAMRNLIEDPDVDIRVSMASFWEIGIKASIGKLSLTTNVLGLEKITESQSMEMLPITVQAIYEAQHLPHHHKDPFDRIIAATAITMGDVLLSVDAIFDAYGVVRVWRAD